MNITNEQVKAVSDLLNTTDKNVIMSACIKTLIDSGLAVDEAIDAVLGSGYFNGIANSIHESLAA